MPSRLIGGALATLLYTAQLASISQDPWFSRVRSPLTADYVAIDLDPMPGVPFAQVRDVARFVGDELASIDAPAYLKTSGSSGLHVYVPLEAGTSYEAGQLFCRIIATLVADAAPEDRDRRTEGRGARPHRVRRLPAEHRRASRWRRPTARGPTSSQGCRRHWHGTNWTKASIRRT